MWIYILVESDILYPDKPPSDSQIFQHDQHQMAIVKTEHSEDLQFWHVLFNLLSFCCSNCYNWACSVALSTLSVFQQVDSASCACLHATLPLTYFIGWAIHPVVWCYYLYVHFVLELFNRQSLGIVHKVKFVKLFLPNSNSGVPHRRLGFPRCQRHQNHTSLSQACPLLPRTLCHPAEGRQECL